MNAVQGSPTVISMLYAPTLQALIHVHVRKDTLEVENNVQVSH